MSHVRLALGVFFLLLAGPAVVSSGEASISNLSLRHLLYVAWTRAREALVLIENFQ